MSPGGTASAQRCGCGSVCWLCYDRNISGSNNSSGGPVDLTTQAHDSPSQIQSLDSSLAPHQASGMSDNTQSTKSNNVTVIRPLRSWSSSEKRGPSLEDPRRTRGPRSFTVTGPSAAAASNSSAKSSAAGSRRSHVLASLHTWAEEEDEPADSGLNPAFVDSRERSSRLLQQQGYVEFMRTQSSRFTHHRQHSTTSVSTSGGNSGGMAVRRTMPEAAFSFIDIGSSNSSSIGGGPLPPSTAAAANASSTAAGGRSAMPHHQRLRTPYSISIPSIIGSPLSFTQPFLATTSRTSMYGRQPPSSQIRAAHIDWDSLSMAEEMLGPSPPIPWGGAVLSSSGNRAGGAGDLPLWQHGAAIDHPFFLNGANGSGGAFAPLSSSDKNAALHSVAGTAKGAADNLAAGGSGESASGIDYQRQLANYYYYQQYLLQSQLHMLPAHLQSAAKQHQKLSYQQLQLQQQQQQQQQLFQHQYPQKQPQHQIQNQTGLFSELSPGQIANPSSAAAAAVTAAGGGGMMHTNGRNSNGNVGLFQPPHMEITEAYEAAMAQLTLASEFEKQMSWDYACQRHPMLSSFAVATPLRLSSAWRWGLLCIILASAGCVLVGTPVALMVLLAQPRNHHHHVS